MYHPFEIAVTGFSGSGKTTLISKLVRKLRDRFDIGYVKHDAHKFVMDKPGKDTWEAWEAGVRAVHINDPRHSAWIGPPEPTAATYDMFAECDFVIQEGRKRSDMPKFFMIDPRDEAQGLFAEAPPANVIAVLGPSGRPDYVPHDLLFVQRDDIDRVVDLLLDHLSLQWSRIPVKALILAGGHSKRMGVDKAFLDYHGKPQVQHMLELARIAVDEVFVSCRPDQTSDPRLAGYNLLPDRFIEMGPAGAILTALHTEPATAWLVLACDMPFADGQAINNLLEQRRPSRIATAYLGHQDLPEPLFAIWEPRSRYALHKAFAENRYCPQKVLINSHSAAVEPKDRRVVSNANHPDERKEAEAALAGNGDNRQPGFNGAGAGTNMPDRANGAAPTMNRAAPSRAEAQL